MSSSWDIRDGCLSLSPPFLSFAPYSPSFFLFSYFPSDRGRSEIFSVFPSELLLPCEYVKCETGKEGERRGVAKNVDPLED